jgi:hypothetical protein
MRRIKIGSSRTGAVVMTGTSVRADSPHFITRAWRRAATPVTHASGIRSIASQRKSLFPLGSRPCLPTWPRFRRPPVKG